MEVVVGRVQRVELQLCERYTDQAMKGHLVSAARTGCSDNNPAKLESWSQQALIKLRQDDELHMLEAGSGSEWIKDNPDLVKCRFEFRFSRW
jgi:hypothetical protein